MHELDTNSEGPMEKQSSRKRCDLSGHAHAGSQSQIQNYVNECPDVLDAAISDALSLPMSIRWVSPLRSERYREYQDSAFLRALGLGKLRSELTSFWPKGGPVWDALGVRTESYGVLLLESKGHVPEIFGSGCRAKAKSSVQRIDVSLAATRKWLGVDDRADWKGHLYQSANRLAHLYFFREVAKIDAWLVNVYFIDDPHCKTSESEWRAAVADVKKSLGVCEIPFYADVYLPAIC